VLAGTLEFKKGNTFGMTAFLSYGFFWISLVVLLLLPKIDASFKPDDSAMAAYLGMWGLFTLGLFIATFRLNIALQVVFGTLVILFFMLAALHALHLGESFEHLTGWEGVFCGAAAYYTGLAQVLNEVYGRTVLPGLA
jgi:succinate-acetate transporter protein